MYNAHAHTQKCRAAAACQPRRLHLCTHLSSTEHGHVCTRVQTERESTRAGESDSERERAKKSKEASCL